MVALFREPFGLPVFPAANWPAVFLPFFIKIEPPWFWLRYCSVS